MLQTGGLILCGGKSSRMGHDKAALRFEGETLLQRVLGRMQQVASPVVVSISATAPAPRLPPEVLMTRDEQPEQGPLWGLLEGFRALSGKAGQVLVLPVDMPFFTVEWMRRLEAGLVDHRACLCEWDGMVNALTAAYRMDLLPKLEELVAAGRMRPLFISQDEPTRIVAVEEHWREGRGPPPMMDVDTPEAYRDALLLDGIGNAGGAPVTIEWAHREGQGTGKHTAMDTSVDTAPGLPLFAASADEALRMAARLYPEWRTSLERAEQAGGLRVLHEDGSGQTIQAHAELAAGMRIAVDIGDSLMGRRP